MPGWKRLKATVSDEAAIAANLAARRRWLRGERAEDFALAMSQLQEFVHACGLLLEIPRQTIAEYEESIGGSDA